jgi:hypothetical protein
MGNCLVRSVYKIQRTHKLKETGKSKSTSADHPRGQSVVQTRRGRNAPHVLLENDLTIFGP